MKQIYLHVGAHKTATTFLQWNCFPELTNVHYGFSSRPNSIFEAVAATVHAHEAFFNGCEEQRKLAAELERAPRDKILISREGLFGDLYRSYRDNFSIARRLAAIAPSAKLIIMIRRQDTWLRSCYSQSLKGGNHISLARFLNYRDGCFLDHDPHDLSLQFGAKYLDWSRFIGHYAELFGRDNLLVVPFERFRPDQAGVLRSITDFLQVPQITPNSSTPINESLSAASERVLRVLNRIFRDRLNPGGLIPSRPYLDSLQNKRNESAIYAVLASLSGRISPKYICENYVDRVFKTKPASLDPKMAAQVIALHRDANRRLDQEYALGLADYGYY